MLGLSKRTDYALLALSYLARAEEGRAVRAREIAEEHDMPVELLSKILQKLARAGMLASAPGPTGGYVMARIPDDISVGAVIAAVEGRAPALVPCMKRDDHGCEQHTKCTIRMPLASVNARVHHLLANITLSEINGQPPQTVDALPARATIGASALRPTARDGAPEGNPHHP
ncbi:MAG TPA: Rrf2 family transcriptional regulator [Chthonomonadales bacterium]|nr:Rrf2 family transcriptional regulator [Chthonomonadales bacterium]